MKKILMLCVLLFGLFGCKATKGNHGEIYDEVHEHVIFYRVHIINCTFNPNDLSVINDKFEVFYFHFPPDAPYPMCGMWNQDTYWDLDMVNPWKYRISRLDMFSPTLPENTNSHVHFYD